MGDLEATSYVEQTARCAGSARRHDRHRRRFRRPDDLLDEVRTAHAYQALTDEEWRWVLDFVVRGGSSA